MSEFPAELVERCAKVLHDDVAQKVGSDQWDDLDVRQTYCDYAIAILRASGHAELVAALEEIAELRVGLGNGLHGWTARVREIARSAVGHKT